MQGYVLVDAVHYRLATINGSLFKEVGFGWGILGHLDPGGRFTVRQQELDDNVWEISSMSVSFTGKILLFKNLSINSTETFTGFKRVPSDLTFAQALELLKKEESSVVSSRDGACPVSPAPSNKTRQAVSLPENRVPFISRRETSRLSR
jgi:hypothetical protein